MIDKEFLIYNLKKTYIIQILILFMAIFYIYYNPLLKDLTFDEFKYLGISGLSRADYEKLQTGHDLTSALPIIMKIKDSFNQDTMPILMHELPRKLVILLIKRLLKFACFVDLPTQICLYVFLTLLMSNVCFFKTKVKELKWRDFFKQYAFILSVVLIIGIILCIPTFIRFMSFRNSIIQKIPEFAQNISSGNYFPLIGVAGEYYEKFNEIKASAVFAEQMFELTIFIIFFISLFSFWSVQIKGFNIYNFYVSFKENIKHYKFSVLASIIFMLFLWIIFCWGSIIITEIFLFGLLQYFSLVMKKVSDTI